MKLQKIFCLIWPHNIYASVEKVYLYETDVGFDRKKHEWWVVEKCKHCEYKEYIKPVLSLK